MRKQPKLAEYTGITLKGAAEAESPLTVQ